MKEINSSNIDEFLYEVGGTRIINPNWFKRKWWDVKIAHRQRQQKKFTKYLRKFLIGDIQELRYLKKTNFTRLRYLDENGILKSAMFRIKYNYGSVTIKPYLGGVPLDASKPKGPMKFKEIECYAIQYKKLGLQRVPIWNVPFRSLL